MDNDPMLRFLGLARAAMKHKGWRRMVVSIGCLLAALPTFSLTQSMQLYWTIDSDMISCVYRQRGAQILYLSSAVTAGRGRSVVLTYHNSISRFIRVQPCAVPSLFAHPSILTVISTCLLCSRHLLPCTHHQGLQSKRHCDVAFQRLRRMQPRHAPTAKPSCRLK